MTDHGTMLILINYWGQRPIGATLLKFSRRPFDLQSGIGLNELIKIGCTVTPRVYMLETRVQSVEV